MNRIGLSSLLIGLVAAPNVFSQEQEQVFSGPQVGEKLAPFQMIGVFDVEAGQSLDIVKSIADKPLVLVFVHDLTRPSIAVSRAVMKYAASREKDGLASAMVFLGDDLTAMEARVKRARHALEQNTTIGISPDGQEGPGSYVIRWRSSHGNTRFAMTSGTWRSVCYHGSFASV